MRTLGFCGLLAVIGAMAGWERSGGAPVKDVGSQEHKLAPLSTLAFQYELKAQEETRIIASGSQPFYQGLYVFDGDGNCVAWDDYGGTEVREDSAVIFVPPTQASYRVEVRSFFPMTNDVRVVVR